MTKNGRVLNLSRGFSMKHSQALKSVDACACEWVEFGISVRDLTLAESIKARNEQAKLRDPLEFAELPGVKYRPTEANQAQARAGRLLVMEANQFAAQFGGDAA